MMVDSSASSAGLVKTADAAPESVEWVCESLLSWQCFYSYQTLVAGILALFAAIITIIVLICQIHQRATHFKKYPAREKSSSSSVDAACDGPDHGLHRRRFRGLWCVP